MDIDRRYVLSLLGVSVPAGLMQAAPWFAAAPTEPRLGFRSLETVLRNEFQMSRLDSVTDTPPRCSVEIGYTDLLQMGIQGCHNDRPFAGFPKAHLRIVSSASEPGPAVGSVRLFVCKIEIILSRGGICDGSRPLNFAILPPAPVLIAQHETPAVSTVPQRTGRFPKG